VTDTAVRNCEHCGGPVVRRRHARFCSRDCQVAHLRRNGPGGYAPPVERHVRVGFSGSDWDLIEENTRLAGYEEPATWLHDLALGRIPTPAPPGSYIVLDRKPGLLARLRRTAEASGYDDLAEWLEDLAGWALTIPSRQRR